MATNIRTSEAQDAVAQAVAILAAVEGRPGIDGRTIPDVHWLHGDDLCDCRFQRIAEWTNPYLAETLRVRLCCIWRKLYEQYPEYVQDIPAYYDANSHKWVTEPAEWDNDEADMPSYLWYRQLAKQQNRPLAEVRAEYADRLHERPKAVPVHPEQQADAAKVAAARDARLRLGGWIIDGR